MSDDERRVVVVTVSDEMLPELLTAHAGRGWEIVAGLPEGSQFVALHPEPFFGRTHFKFRHPSFAVVGDGCSVPTFNVTCRRVEADTPAVVGG